MTCGHITRVASPGNHNLRLARFQGMNNDLRGVPSVRARHGRYRLQRIQKSVTTRQELWAVGHFTVFECDELFQFSAIRGDTYDAPHLADVDPVIRGPGRPESKAILRNIANGHGRATRDGNL